MKSAASVLVVVSVMAGVVVGVAWGGLHLYRWIAPQRAAAERAVFEQTPSFVHGKITHLSRLRAEHSVAEPEHRSALRSTILAEASLVEGSRLPADLRRFIEDLKRGEQR